MGELVTAIQIYIDAHNADPKPFVGTAQKGPITCCFRKAAQHFMPLRLGYRHEACRNSHRRQLVGAGFADFNPRD
jgi:hypothetical protein